MEPYMQTILAIVGVAISVVLFVIGYRQTIGARKERVRAANTDLEKTLLRRIVLESYQPTVDGVARLIEGKARDHRVKPRDLYSESQVLNTIFTRILESDFITPEQRSGILGRLSPVLQKAEEAPFEEALFLELPTERKRVYTRTIVPLFMGVLASVMGALVVLLLTLTDGAQLLTPAVLTAFIGSFTVIIMIFLAYRLREAQEETSSASALQAALEFEEEVQRVLQKIDVGAKTHVRANIGGRESEFDFIAEIGDRRILIEVKAWSRRVPISILRDVVGKLRQAIEALGADEAILVTKGALDLPPGSLEDARIRTMTLRELRNYLVHGMA